MGFFDVLKKSRKQVNRDNQEQGRVGEKKIKDEYEFSGYKVSRTGKGHDLKAEKKDWFGNKTTKYIEVKTGNSKLSKLQKKKRDYLGDKYVVERLEPTPFGLSTNNRESDLSSKQKKKKSVMDSIFGSSSSTKKKSTPKKKQTSIWGSSSSTKKKSTPKKKQTSIWGSSSTDSIFGSSSSTKKKSSSSTKKKSTPKKKQTSIWGSSSKSKKNTGIW